MSTTNRVTWRGVAFAILKLAIAVGLLAWLVDRGWLDLRPLASTGHAGLHALALAIQLGVFVLQGVRWRILLKTFSIDVRTRDAIAITFIGLFGALLLPGGLGIEVIRAVYVARARPGRKTATSVSVLLDRLVGLYAFMALGSGALVWHVATGSPHRAFAAKLLPFVAAPFAAMTVGLAAPWFPALRRLALRLTPARLRPKVETVLAAYASSPRDFAAALAISAFTTAGVAAIYLIASRIAGADADWATVASVSPIVVVAGVLPITPQGIGVAEASSAALFSGFGVASGATIALLVRVWAAAISLLGAVFYVRRRAEIEAAPPAA